MVATENTNPAERTDHAYANISATMEKSWKGHIETFFQVIFGPEQKLSR